MTKYGSSLTRALPYKDRILSIRENKDQRKTVVWHILRRDQLKDFDPLTTNVFYQIETSQLIGFYMM